MKKIIIFLICFLPLIASAQAVAVKSVSVPANSTFADYSMPQWFNGKWRLGSITQIKNGLAYTKADIGLPLAENQAFSTWAGTSNITTLGTIATGTWNANVIGPNKGGTGQNAYAIGDILYSGATNALNKLSGNITTTRMFLSQLGTGSASSAPLWSVITIPDVAWLQDSLDARARAAHVHDGDDINTGTIGFARLPFDEILNGTGTFLNKTTDYGAGTGNVITGVPTSGLAVTHDGSTLGLPLPAISAPTYTSGAATLYTKTARGGQRLAQVSQKSSYVLQRSFISGQSGVILFTGPTTSSNMGMGAGTPVGTATQVTLTTNDTYYKTLFRTAYVSASTAGSSAGIFSALRRWFISSTANFGGFTMSALFGDGSAATVANQRSLMGMWGTDGAPGNVEPSSLVNFIGMAYDAGGTTWKIMHNDGSGTATIIDLGANFPVSNSSDAYMLTIYIPPGNAALAEYYVQRINSSGVISHTANGTITTNLPAADTRLGWVRWINNGSTALASSAEIMWVAMDVETTF